MRRTALTTLALVCLVFAASCPLHADEFETVQLWTSVTCSICITPDFQSFQAQFNWDLTTGTVEPGTMSVTASGPLGAFSFLEAFMALPDVPSFVFQNSFQDEITLWPVNPFYFQTGESDGTHLGITCGTPGDTCNVEGFAGYYPLHGGITAIPESGEPILLLVSLLGFLFLLRRRYRSLQSHR